MTSWPHAGHPCSPCPSPLPFQVAERDRVGLLNVALIVTGHFVLLKVADENGGRTHERAGLRCLRPMYTRQRPWGRIPCGAIYSQRAALLGGSHSRGLMPPGWRPRLKGAICEVALSVSVLTVALQGIRGSRRSTATPRSPGAVSSSLDPR